jgi:hypothetical protein
MVADAAEDEDRLDGACFASSFSAFAESVSSSSSVSPSSSSTSISSSSTADVNVREEIVAGPCACWDTDELGSLLFEVVDLDADDDFDFDDAMEVSSRPAPDRESKSTSEAPDDVNIPGRVLAGDNPSIL